MATQTAAPRIGLYGGAFDPPHLAHLALVTVALSQLRLDRLHLVPTGQAWHKPRSLSSAHHRLAMCALAFAGISQVLVDEREILRQGATFTVETLRELRQENPSSPLFLIIGADQARDFNRWKSWSDILDMATVCVAPRAVDAPTAKASSDDGSIATRFLSLDMQPMAISATDIRHRVAAGLSVLGLVSQPVAGYIAKQHLYQDI